MISKYMRLRILLNAMLVLTAAAVSSCNKNINDEIVFIQDAMLEEEGRTCEPGGAIHLKGSGYQQTDNVMLTFTWETGDRMMPVGKASGIYAKKQDAAPDGIIAVLPYRYPAADVEVSIMREGQLQKIGSLKITDGRAPKDLRLYGLGSESKSIEGFTLDINNVGSRCLGIALPEDLHSVINVPRSFGICGIMGRGEHRSAVLVDFFTGESETLADDVLALFMTPANAAVAVVGRDGVCTLRTLSIEVGTDYMTKSYSPAPVQPTFTLPEGLKPEYFGDYPGVPLGTAEHISYLLSACRGNGSWTTVILDKDGFRKAEDIEAGAVIPFRAGNDAGYILAYDGGPDLFCTVDPKTGLMNQAIYTCKMSKIVSATSNPEKPDHILLNFAEAFNGTKIYDLDWHDLKTLSPIALPHSAGDYAEVLMAN